MAATVSAVSPDWPNRYDERRRIQERFAVAEFGCRFGLGGYAGQTFHQMATYVSRVQAGAAAYEHYPTNPGELSISQSEVRQRYQAPAKIHAVPEGGGHRLGLLHDFP